MKVFADANILFSASAPDSAIRRLLDGASEFGHVLTNQHAWEEAKRNLDQKRPHFSKELDRLAVRVQMTRAFAPKLSVQLPQQDIPILAGAVGAGCTHLWTGDRRHFGQFYGKSVDDVLVVSSVMLTDLLIDLGWTADGG